LNYRTFDPIAIGGVMIVPEHVWIWTARRTLPSERGAHMPCMQEVLETLQSLGWDGRDLFGVEMALEESLTNAIRHGNQLDESKRVEVECRVSRERFWLRVEDEGNGFRLQNVPDCTADENLECCGGRGLALIKAYMTSVEYNERGNCVTLEKIRSTADHPTPSCRPCEPDETATQ
jgi:serine/threonine-protein kinase RsbW